MPEITEPPTAEADHAHHGEQDQEPRAVHVERAARRHEGRQRKRRRQSVRDREGGGSRVLPKPFCVLFPDQPRQFFVADFAAYPVGQPRAEHRSGVISSGRWSPSLQFSQSMRWLAHPVATLSRRLDGGRRAKVIVLFACVFGLDGADKGSVGAMALPLQQAFHIGKTEFGLLLTVSLSATACSTFLFGWLVDRTDRVRLLAWTIIGWAVAIGCCGLAPSYGSLIVMRIALGGAAASAAPAIASLIGDYFPSEERGAVYSSVLAGEILGSGTGFLLCGELAAWTWRAGFFALAVPALFLARAVHTLPEPERGSGGHLSQRERRSRHQKTSTGVHLPGGLHAKPRRELVLKGDPSHRSLWWVLKYVLRVPTNRVLIVASALGYFYFTGLRTFGVEYIRLWLDVSHGAAIALIILVGSGALAGVLASGRLADWLLERGRVEARIIVAVLAYFATTGVFVLSMLTRRLWLELPLLGLAAAGLGAINPPLDAARLDIMPAALWGRAESVRTCLRTMAEAAAPITFGYAAEHWFGGPTSGTGLHATLFFMLIALGGGGASALFAIGSYPRDVATARASG